MCTMQPCTDTASVVMLVRQIVYGIEYGNNTGETSFYAKTHHDQHAKHLLCEVDSMSSF